MNNLFDFSTFSRQSTKGILVIYIAHLYKFLKLTWILVFLIVKDFTKITNKIDAIYIYAGIAFFLIFFLIRTYLIFKNFQFKIENEHFILKQGILKKTNTAIPFHRIQNINFKQNIVQQIIGVFEVSIETAGSSTTEISIKALSLQKATALKEIISKNTKLIEEEVVEKQETKPLVRIGVKELFKVSLTENHLQNLLLFFAIVFGLLQQLQQLSDSLGQTEAIDGFIEENTNAISASIFLVIIILLLLTIVALVSSFVRVFLVHFNLTAYLKEDAFEINQGLFTKKSIILKKQKIQNITISTNPLKRLIGISFITFKQAVSGKINNKKKDKLIRIVGCKKEQIEIIKASLFNPTDVENSDKKHPENYFKRRLFIFTFLFLILAYTITYVVYSHFEIFYSTIVVVPIVVFLILKKVKKRFYKISDEMILVGKGLLETHITYLEIFKVQNIEMQQTIFQKRSNVADLILQTASGKIKIPCIDFQEAIKIYNHTLYKVETSQTSWM
ncbi:PH domain-containing protein [Polaribacter sp. Hel_I_88]|uniref:PH domain-containing protein n=1 Tax=Polaribacter sp. Hel_I_88 TaxID=1250006 RepID=UPI000479057D|nr:PH domain-containing protein [Polaribacter sp. Hel_I_88]